MVVIRDINKDLSPKAKDLAFKTKAMTKDLTLKAKTRTTVHNFIVKDN